ncbi:MAG: hypothetical protein A2268_08395 [Candidatus Raymondbacteria bacterium RifOxyA12_full_50_37]|uniref:CheW-like domain-containing protein n=1 Tax=Candidatus Raymondbacteria bacterium RIFOXYD12_FULL_49_13 TaxID=1817890 RepID=A0A1F7F424_UNCRA|nr:MAG: hypothetical protein A2268_08395 [Candidatus Raymondbacteria bacterium RifOxyA12_full_50_37]OGJ90352.1 MAG: hypothetical protein A2248_17330 [Candidatus Raymondbacteria bacterium RIFOXYA2_FULL_49_16]OGK01312.1 MAG: hypothetical protein A2519_12985 [Candidatus Raymondbacteria bacterium RIFOXYD12_FULL_49_13]OGP43251.1 MAG: hypothetical protein A2324_08160 [Candidatus Raymondbacteria bacterium RIFOXYB2_FULL_49_35]
METQFATFYLGKDLFGVNILLVREINRNFSVTPVEHAPAYVAGLMNLRGQIVTALDLCVMLGMHKQAAARAARVIILKTAQELAQKHADPALVKAAPADFTGLIVGEMGDMVVADSGAIERPPANIGGIQEKYLIGVVKLEDRLVGILDIGTILTSA